MSMVYAHFKLRAHTDVESPMMLSYFGSPCARLGHRTIATCWLKHDCAKAAGNHRALLLGSLPSAAVRIMALIIKARHGRGNGPLQWVHLPADARRPSSPPPELARRPRRSSPPFQPPRFAHEREARRTSGPQSSRRRRRRQKRTRSAPTSAGDAGYQSWAMFAQ